MRKVLWTIGAVIFAAGIGFGVYGVSLWRASQRVPEFYQEAIDVRPEVQAQAGRQMEETVRSLQTEAKRPGEWQAIFTDEQINGWLAAEMPYKFPRALPPAVSDPRVAIQENEAWLGCRYDGNGMSAVVSIGLDVRMTNEPNVLAVRVRAARAGEAPLPVKPWLEQITRAAAQSNIPVRWIEEDGEPVALVTVPSAYEEIANKRVFLEKVALKAGELHLAGHTVDAAASDAPTPVEPRLLGIHQESPAVVVPASHQVESRVSDASSGVKQAIHR